MPGFIEFLGLPASGKTSLLESLVPIAAKRDLNLLVPLPRAPSTPKERWDKFTRDLTSVASVQCGAPSVSWKIWRACTQFEQPTTTQRVRMYLNCLRLEGLVRQYRKAALDDDVIAFDQGLFQAVWSLALRADIKDRDVLERRSIPILETMTKPDLVVFVDTPPELAHRRLLREPSAHGRLLALLEEDSGWMARAHEHLETIWKLSGQQQGVEAFRFEPEKFAAQDLVGLIKRCCLSNGVESKLG